MVYELFFTPMQLNFPTYNFQTRTEAGKTVIYDCIRKRFVVLTPEEWVRQHVLCFLVQTKQYSAALIAVEREIKFNKLKKRFDALLFDKNGKPLILIECKSFDVPLTRETLFQVSTYNTNFNVPYLFVSNGLQHMLFVLDAEKGYQQTADFPIV